MTCAASINPRDQESADAADARDMERLAAGDDSALNDLMSRHAATLFRFLTRMVDDPDDGGELAQEAFARVYRNRKAFRTGARFSTWLYTIAGNLGRNHLRWRARHPGASLEAVLEAGGAALGDRLADGSPGPRERMEAAERVLAIRAAVAGLPEELRAPLILAEYEERPQEEIGRLLGCSTKAVESRLYRARRRLRARLAGLLG